MKKALGLTLAAMTLCATLVGCNGTPYTTARSVNRVNRTRRTYSYSQPYRGNVSTSRDGTVNGTNRYIGSVNDMLTEW